MMIARIARRKAARPAPRSLAGHDLARLLAPQPWLTATAKQQDWTRRTAERAIGNSWTSRKGFDRPEQSTIPTMPAADKSP
jgi:hypothetical protein